MKTFDKYDIKIFTDNVDEEAVEQIMGLVSIPVFQDCKIRIMPDVHRGAGCVIGFTGNLGEKVIPNIVGMDIGCGLLVQPFENRAVIDFHALNEYILRHIPSGMNYRDKTYIPLSEKYISEFDTAREIVMNMRCLSDLKYKNRLFNSIGSLGGGNHFIEVDGDENGKNYLVVHTGSRNLGKQVAEIYQEKAIHRFDGYDEMIKERNRVIEEYRNNGQTKLIQKKLDELMKAYKSAEPEIPRGLSYIEGSQRDDYLHDMRLCQQWAKINRRLIVDLLLEHLRDQNVVEGLPEDYKPAAFESVHNYIADDDIIRKGAISAGLGEQCIIPLNMRDGSLLCEGKGNADWNFSAPHGAGRIMSRRQAFRTLDLEDFRQSMQWIYSETVTAQTMDEAPMVYKPKDEIIANIQDTVTIKKIIKPVFNYKAAGD